MLLGVSAGIWGVFTVLRTQSLLGDAIAHAALPGICLSYIICGYKSMTVVFVGALLSGVLGSMVLLVVSKHTHLKEDAILGVVLSVFFGFGIVLLTYIQRLPLPDKSGLNDFLFGNAAILLKTDILPMIVLVILSLSIIALFWTQIKMSVFDPDFSHIIGIPVRYILALIMACVIITIVVGLQLVGVVLMSSMMIAPSVAARQWTNRLVVMVVLSACFGALASVCGAVLSSQFARFPTGPSVVLVSTFFVLISLIFSPIRGLFWKYRMRRNLLKTKKKIFKDSV